MKKKMNYTQKRKNEIKWNKNALTHFYLIFQANSFFFIFGEKMKCVSHFIFIHFISFFHFIWFFWFLVIFKLYFIFFQISFYFIFLYESCFISFYFIFLYQGGPPGRRGAASGPAHPAPSISRDICKVWSVLTLKGAGPPKVQALHGHTNQN